MPACMPVGDAGSTFTGESTTATGWGKLSDASPGASEYLFEAEGREVMANDQCARTYGSTITDGHLCIDTGDHSGVCSGDSGGPLNYNVGGNKYKQLGVASFVASAGCESGLPHAYTRVSEYVDFITENAGTIYE